MGALAEMGWLFKTLLRLLVLAAVVFVGWAFFAELPPPTESRTIVLPPPTAAGGDGGS